MDSINHSLIRNCLLIFYFSLISVHEVFSSKCLWHYINSTGLYPDEKKTKDLEPYGITVKPESIQSPVTESSFGPTDSANKSNPRGVPIAGYNNKNRDERKKNRTSFTSERKKMSLQLDKNITQAEATRHTSFDSYMNWKPAEGNWTTFGLHLEIPVTDKIFLQICAVEIALILILLFSLRYYVLELKSTENSVSEIMARAQEVAYSTAEDYRSSQRYPEREDENESSTSNDELTLMIASSMVNSHLKNLVNEIKESKQEENLEKYLTEEFLQLISDRIAQEGYMRSNFQNHLTAESLFQLGLYYYQRNKKSGKSEQVSLHLESNEVQPQQYCTRQVNHRDVTVNLGVHVGGQETKTPQSKTEKQENSLD